MESFRAFIALELPAPVVAHVEAVSAALQSVEGARAFTWVRPESLHVTVHFLGPLSVDKVDAVGTVLHASVEAFPVGALRTTGVGTFPEGRPPRVVWLGLDGEGVRSLRRMHLDLVEGLRPLGFAAADHAYTPHITLARARKTAANHVLRDARAAFMRIPVEKLGFDAHRVSLMESTPGPTGAVYTPRIAVELA